MKTIISTNKFILLLFLSSFVLNVQSSGSQKAKVHVKVLSDTDKIEVEKLRAAYKVKCPKLECLDNPIGKLSVQAAMIKPPLKRCYQIGTDKSTETVKGYECYDAIANKKKTDVDTQYCPFNIDSGEFAWVNEMDQFSILPNDYVSQFEGKKLDSFCRDVKGLLRDLLPGRTCNCDQSGSCRGDECRSSLCKEKMCKGQEKDTNCHDNTDCDNGLYCRESKQWPFSTQCTTLNGEFDICDNEYECQNNQMCWFSDEEYKKHGIKTCMPLYSQDDGATFGWQSKPQVPPDADNLKPTLADFKENGRYCKSGLAYPASANLAVCTSFTAMEFYEAATKKVTVLKESEQDSAAYRCSPEDQANTCRLRFKIQSSASDTYVNTADTSRSYVENQCKCALDGKETSGYCSSTLGTKKYTKAVQALQRVNTLSNCHTMDRFNMRAQKDKSCGIGKNNDEWRFAVDQVFNMTYWPYIQDTDTYMCIRKFFSNSFDSLVLEGANFGISVSLATILGLTIVSSI